MTFLGQGTGATRLWKLDGAGWPPHLLLRKEWDRSPTCLPPTLPPQRGEPPKDIQKRGKTSDDDWRVCCRTRRRGTTRGREAQQRELRGVKGWDAAANRTCGGGARERERGRAGGDDGGPSSGRRRQRGPPPPRDVTAAVAGGRQQRAALLLDAWGSSYQGAASTHPTRVGLTSLDGGMQW